MVSLSPHHSSKPRLHPAARTPSSASAVHEVVETGIFRLEKALNMGYCLELIAKKR